MNTNPCISVIIPVFNCEQYLAEAIESVLNQTYRPLDIIVIDDGSTDRSGNIARSYLPQLRYHSQTNSGISCALNQGIKMAKGSFVAFLDADDLWVRNKLERQMQAFTNNPSLDAVFSNIQQFYSPDMDQSVRQLYQIKQKILHGYCADTLLLAKHVFDRIGYFDNNFRAVGFMDWYAKAREQNINIDFIPEILAKRRIHTTNMSIKNKDLINREYSRMLKAALNRRRAINKGHDSG